MRSGRGRGSGLTTSKLTRVSALCGFVDWVGSWSEGLGRFMVFDFWRLMASVFFVERDVYPRLNYTGLYNTSRVSAHWWMKIWTLYVLAYSRSRFECSNRYFFVTTALSLSTEKLSHQCFTVAPSEVTSEFNNWRAWCRYEEPCKTQRISARGRRRYPVQYLHE